MNQADKLANNFLFFKGRGQHDVQSAPNKAKSSPLWDFFEVKKCSGIGKCATAGKSSGPSLILDYLGKE